MKKYKDWELLDEMPDGWVIDKSAGSPVCGYEFITNGKSVLNGQKRALLAVRNEQHIVRDEVQKEHLEIEPHVRKNINLVMDEHCVRAVNELARKKFEQRLLNDIMVDLMICEIEGWGKKEYINELQELIGSLLNDKPIASESKRLGLLQSIQ